jgi:hypothetical protein
MEDAKAGRWAWESTVDGKRVKRGPVRVALKGAVADRDAVRKEAVRLCEALDDAPGDSAEEQMKERGRESRHANSPMKCAGRRDASFFAYPGLSARYHVATDDCTLACWRRFPLVETSLTPLADVPPHLRCMRRGCREHWETTDG